MRGIGIDPDEIEEIVRLRDAYFEHLREEIVRPVAEPSGILPGVLALIDALDRRPDVVVGLLTGNFVGARASSSGTSGSGRASASARSATITRIGASCCPSRSTSRAPRGWPSTTSRASSSSATRRSTWTARTRTARARSPWRPGSTTKPRSRPPARIWWSRRWNPSRSWVGLVRQEARPSGRAQFTLCGWPAKPKLAIDQAQAKAGGSLWESNPPLPRNAGSGRF